ncbi:hypothetical protein L211DRAFT_867092 [Terfezia boudieri ATCC MYA-4762]|uniref:Uncharacterized protein n=1 Tax=Terfezia boudieri ATCC MYA-4762 TaxID=1051890 RepID=A0A3N4LRQ0_9PEZI|nr:hypothetical protein L211DRAFT_867092 [Terfezia boudieri ATCC MYA-4762]
MSVRNSVEMVIDSAANQPMVEQLEETQQTITHPPEEAPELLHVTAENEPVVTSCTQDYQDTVSVRGAWVQGVLNACDPLGIGPGGRSTTTDGGQNLMTPGTATAMSMSLESLSTPTVTGGGCPSDEPSEPQRLEHEETDESNETMVSCCVNGDLLLHVRYQSNQEATTEASAPILSLQVSSEILRIASDPLKLLLDTPPVSMSRTPAGLHHLIAIHEPRVWGRREGRGTVAFILKAPIQSEQLRQAALTVFNIIHPNKYRPTEAPSMLQIAWIAELAWVLDCLSPIVPWIKSWIGGCPRVDADTRLVSALILGFVMGDSETFEQASLHLVLRGRKSDFDRFEGSSLGVMIVIQHALQRKRQEVSQGLIDILNESLHSYCGSDKQPGNFDQTFILGAFFSAVCNSSTGVTMVACDSIPAVGPAFHFQWQPQMNEQSINFLVGKILAITEKFNAQLQLHRLPKSSEWENPVPPLAAKVVRLREKLRGLTLTDFRPEAAKLMNTNSSLGYVGRLSEMELERLRKYSVPTVPTEQPSLVDQLTILTGKHWEMFLICLATKNFYMVIIPLFVIFLLISRD